MPAIYPTNIRSLKRINKPLKSQLSRIVQRIVDAPHGFEGNGFPVRRALSLLSTHDTDPFIMMDQMGEVEYEIGEAKGTPWHPHRGFETVTYLIDGIFEHQDSNGGGGTITNGDTQWMTAGSGILHIESPPQSAVLNGGLFHGVQIWVNLPTSLKWSHPRYQDIHSDKLKILASADGTSIVRLIAGSIDGVIGPGITHTPISMFHASISPGGSLLIPWASDFNAIGYVLAGHGSVGTGRISVYAGQCILFGHGDFLEIYASPVQDSRSSHMELLVLGGRPIREPVAWQGPFVMNTRNELKQAFQDYKDGRLGTVPVIKN